MTADVDALDRFIASSLHHADHVAVSCDGDETSYGALDRLARQLAASIVTRAPGNPKVLIVLPPGAAAYAAMIGTGLAGGVYAPVNLRAPQDKQRAVCVRFAPDVIIAHERDWKALQAEAPGAVHLDPDALPDIAPFEGRGTRHPLAYVIHTSGSTGVPKGVEIPRDALNHYVAWIAHGVGPTPADRLSQYANIAFDLSVLEIYGALCFGASLHPPGGMGDRLLPARMIARETITIWVSVPSVVGLMARAGELTPGNMRSVRRFVFCGEPLLTEQVRALFDACPDAVVQNTYGPTEATVSMTSLTLTRTDLPQLSRRAVPIGCAIENMGLILNGGPDVDEGEIVLTGPQLARGYAHDALATDRAFRPVETPAGPRRGYHTGDWARRINGEIHFEERIDFQIKHKGYRIEIGEILDALARCGHADACVFAHDGRLIALIEGRGNPDVTRGAVGRLIDPHAVPDVVRFVDRLPRGETDKIDRRAAVSAFVSADHPVDQGCEIAHAIDRIDVAVAQHNAEPALHGQYDIDHL